jgi:hypothetical protein
VQIITTFRQQIEEKTVDLLGEDRFGFGPRKGSKDAFGC